MKIFCVGRNYAAHARELGNEVPEEPVIFMKPHTALVPGGGRVVRPAFTRELHYEVELVLRVSSTGRGIEVAAAGDYFDAIGVGIDFTARDVQKELKDKGLPWEKAKGFDGAAPVSADFIAIGDVPDPGNTAFRLEKNGEVVQSGNSGSLLFGFAELLAHISAYFTLEPGDLVFTGTPAGVGVAEPGDRLAAYISHRRMLEVEIADPA